MIKTSFFICVMCSLLWVAGVVVPDDRALAQKATAVEKISFGIPAMDAGFLPLFVARDRKFFRDEGIEAEIVHVKADIATKAIATGDLDFSAAAGSVARAATAGMLLRSFSIPPGGRLFSLSLSRILSMLRI
jgi:ABC-type nitrate/sulfonate/bicarbonate transport system substrate-binding protein